MNDMEIKTEAPSAGDSSPAPCSECAGQIEWWKNLAIKRGEKLNKSREISGLLAGRLRWHEKERTAQPEDLEALVAYERSKHHPNGPGSASVPGGDTQAAAGGSPAAEAGSGR